MSLPRALPRRHATQKPPAGRSALDGTSPLVPGLAHCAPINEYAGVYVRDLVQRSYATIVGATWDGDRINFAAGNSLLWPADTDYQLTTFSVTLLFYLPTAISPSRSIVVQVPASGTTGWWIGNPSGGSTGNVGLVVGAGTGAVASVPVSTGVWYWLTVTVAGTAVNTYLTRADRSSDMVTASGTATTISYAGTETFGVGQARSASASAACEVGFLALHKTALQASQVRELHAEPFALFEAPSLSRFWKLLARSFGPFTTTETLWSESSSRNALALAQRTATDSPFLGDSGTRTLNLVGRTATESPVLTGSADRGGLSLPRSVQESGLLDDAGSRGALTLARSITEALWGGAGDRDVLDFTQRSATESPLLSESGDRGSLDLLSRTADQGALLSESGERGALSLSRTMTESFLSEAGSRGYARIPAVAVHETGLLSESALRGALTQAARAMQSALWSEYVPSGTSYPEIEVTETLWDSAAGYGPVTYATRAAVNTALISEAAREGRVAPIGTTAPPIVSTETDFLTGAANRGALQSPRGVTDTLWSSAGVVGAKTLAVRTANVTLLAEIAAGVAVVHAGLAAADTDNRDPFVASATFLVALAGLEDQHMASAAWYLKLADLLAASYRAAESQQAANKLAGLQELVVGDDGVSGTAYGSGDDALILDLGTTVTSIVTAAQPDTVNATIYRPLLTALTSHLSKLGYTSFDAYATSQNSASRDSFLVHPNTAYLTLLYNNKQGSLLMQPGNVFAPLTTFGSATVGASAGQVTYTDQSAIPTTNNATSLLQGYTPAPGVQAIVTTNINGTLSVTVTGNGRDASGNTVTGRTWTASLSNATAGSVITFTPNITGDRISDVTAVTGSGTATAGAFYLQSVLERIVS